MCLGEFKDDETGTFESIVSTARTSYNDWWVNDCWKDPLIQSIAEKAQNITGIPKDHSEFFQVLRCDPSQYYVYVSNIFIQTHE